MKSGSDGSVVLFHATTAYKQWARKTMKTKGFTLASLAAAIKRIDASLPATSGGLSQFFGTEDEIPRPSNTELMPAMNKVLGIPPPALCDPTSPLSQLQDRLADVWGRMTDKERLRIIVAFESMLEMISSRE